VATAKKTSAANSSDDRVEGTSSTIVVNGEKVDLNDTDVPRDQFGTAVIHRLAAENRAKIPFGNDATVATPGLDGPTQEYLGAFGILKGEKVPTPAEQQVEALDPSRLPAMTESQVEEAELAREEAEKRAEQERAYADEHDGVLGAGPVVVPESVHRDNPEAKNSAATKVEAPNTRK
jgi:hypothetical protein